MKNLIVFSFFFYNLIIGQSNFKIDDGELIWQKVYNTETTVNSIEKHLLNTGLIDDLKISNDQIIGKINSLAINYKLAGSSEMLTSMYISRSDFFGTIIIDIKPNRYRVTIKKIKAVQRYDDGLTNQGEQTNIELFSLKKKNSEIRKSFLKKDAHLFEHSFNKISEISKKKDTW